MSGNTIKHPTIGIGDQVRCLRRKTFVDGTDHNPQDLLLVEQETLAYYQTFTDGMEYELWKRA